MEEQVSSRRGFLKVAGLIAGASVAAPALMASQGTGKKGIYSYERKRVASMKQLKANKEVDFSYPDSDSPCKAIITAKGEVKAYSVLCTHKGCPTMYDASKKVFECPCHFSKFDAEKEGQMIIGQATATLPEILVEVEGDNIVAFGTDGLIYGRESNNL